MVEFRDIHLGAPACRDSHPDSGRLTRYERVLGFKPNKNMQDELANVHQYLYTRTFPDGWIYQFDSQCILQLTNNLFPPQLEVHRELPSAFESRIHRMRAHSFDGVDRRSEELERTYERLCRFMMLSSPHSSQRQYDKREINSNSKVPSETHQASQQRKRRLPSHP